jgi:hypothetical protein
LEEKGNRLFVKGPYRHVSTASVPVLVAAMKMLCCPELPVVVPALRLLYVDGFPSTPLGLRRQLYGELCPFLFFPDLTNQHVPVLPTRLHSSASWPPTKVVDWEAVRQANGPGPVCIDALSHVTDQVAFHDLAAAVIFRYLVGCADMCERNFMKVYTRVFSVDEDSILSPNLQIYLSMRSERHLLHLQCHLVNYWDGIFADMLSRWKDRFMRWMKGDLSLDLPTTFVWPVEKAELFEYIQDRLSVLTDKDALLAMFQVPTTRKRKRSTAGESMPPSKRQQHMAMPGWQGGRTAAGYAFDVVKSDFQKAIRTGREDQALKAFFEMYNMESLFPNNVSSKANRTNIMNRLMISAVEDIGPSQVSLVMRILKGVLRMQKKKERRDPKQLAEYVHAAASSPGKTRICSHLWSTYGHPKGRILAKEKGLPIRELMQNDTFGTLLHQKDPNVFALAYAWLEGNKIGKKVLRFEWSTLRCFLCNNQILSMSDAWTLEECFYMLTERRPVLQFALALIILPNVEESINSSSNNVDAPALPLASLLEGEYDYVPHPSAIDKHTHEGRRQGADNLKFIEEGAVVVPQDPRFWDPALVHIYNTLKS